MLPRSTACERDDAGGSGGSGYGAHPAAQSNGVAEAEHKHEGLLSKTMGLVKVILALCGVHYCSTSYLIMTSDWRTNALNGWSAQQDTPRYTLHGHLYLVFDST